MKRKTVSETGKGNALEEMKVIEGKMLKVFWKVGRCVKIQMVVSE